MDGQEALQVTSFNGIKVYHCTAGRSDEVWRKEFKGKERQLKKNEDYQNRLNLIHDFAFPGCATRVKVSPDGRYIAAAGTYKPRLKLFECENMSLKVERYSDEEISQIQFLSDDYSKIACARNDRTIELHTQAGIHTTFKTPRHIRDLSYHRPTCDLYIASNANELYRFNLEQGSFQSSILTGFSEEQGGISSIGLNPIFPILGACGFGGVESYDLRDRTSAGFLDILSTLSDSQSASKHFSTASFVNSHSSSARSASYAAQSQQASINGLVRSINSSNNKLEATCLRYNDETGMEVSIGLSTGHILTYDLRSSRPLYIFDHRYDLPIHSIKYHTSSRTLITADRKSIKLWDYTTPSLSSAQRHLTTINSPSPMNDLSIVNDTGLIFTACDAPQMHIYFVPRLGTAPDWAAALENITEELDHQTQLLLQKQYKLLASGSSGTSLTGSALIGAGSDMSEAIFDDQKFITRDEMEQSGISHLIRTNMVKPYMHGFLIKMSLYEQMKELLQIEQYQKSATSSDQLIDPSFLDESDPRHKSRTMSEFEFIEDQIRKELDHKRDAGFKLESTLPSVNKHLAAALLHQNPSSADKNVSDLIGEPKKSRAKLAKEEEHTQRAKSLLSDDRFSDMFKDDDFEVDYGSDEFKRLNPQLKKGTQNTTAALRRVADPAGFGSIAAPTLADDGSSLDSTTADLLSTERVDQGINATKALKLNEYESKGLLASVGLSANSNTSLDARGQLSSKQIKDRERVEKKEKMKLNIEHDQKAEIERINRLQQQQKQKNLSAFLESSQTKASTGSLLTGTIKQSSQSVKLNAVKTGMGMGQLLDDGNMKSTKQLGQKSAEIVPKKRFLTLADRVHMEEEEKALRERQHIREELHKKRMEAREEKDENAAKKQQKREAFVQNKTGAKKKERNVY